MNKSKLSQDQKDLLRWLSGPREKHRYYREWWGDRLRKEVFLLDHTLRRFPKTVRGFIFFRARKQGMTLDEISMVAGLTKERIRQLAMYGERANNRIRALAATVDCFLGLEDKS